MIEALKHEDIIDKVGGRFKLAALVQKRWKELMFGARPLVDPANRPPLEVVVDEIRQGKLDHEIEALKLDTPHN